MGNAFADIVRDFKPIRCDTVILDNLTGSYSYTFVDFTSLHSCEAWEEAQLEEKKRRAASRQHMTALETVHLSHLSSGKIFSLMVDTCGHCQIAASEMWHVMFSHSSEEFVKPHVHKHHKPNKLQWTESD